MVHVSHQQFFAVNLKDKNLSTLKNNQWGILSQWSILGQWSKEKVYNYIDFQT